MTSQHATGLAFWSSLTLETRSHPWVLAGHPQYTGTHHDGKAVDGPIPQQENPLRTPTIHLKKEIVQKKKGDTGCVQKKSL